MATCRTSLRRLGTSDLELPGSKRSTVYGQEQQPTQSTASAYNCAPLRETGACPHSTYGSLPRRSAPPAMRLLPGCQLAGEFHKRYASRFEFFCTAFTLVSERENKVSECPVNGDHGH